MADRILGLAGKGKGPVVCTTSLGAAKARVTGMKEGRVMVRANFTGDFETHEHAMLLIEKDGVYDVGKFPFMQCEYHGESFMICTLHAG